MLLLLVLVSSLLLSFTTKSLERAKSYLYVREKTYNRSPEIDLWNKYVKNPVASPYCAAFVSFITDGSPIKSGLARAHAKGKFHTIGEVLRREYVVKPGDKVIWARGSSIQGHIGIVLKWNYDRGYTIEANTSSGNSGSQRDGNGVFQRYRIIEPYSYFRIIGFVEM